MKSFDQAVGAWGRSTRLNILAGHYRWPGPPSPFAVRSALEMMSALQAPGQAEGALFLNDLGGLTCGTGECPSMRNPLPTKTLGAEHALLSQVCDIEEAALRPNPGDWLRLAVDLGRRLSSETTQPMQGFWQRICQPSRNYERGAIAPWLLDIERALYWMSRRDFRPLALSRLCGPQLRGSRLPRVHFEKTMTNSSTRWLHKAAKQGHAALQRLRGDEGEVVYRALTRSGPVELRREQSDRGRPWGHNRCPIILTELFRRLLRSDHALAGPARSRTLIYIVPSSDRGRLESAVEVFEALHGDICRQVEAEEVRLAFAFYTEPTGDTLFFRERTFRPGSPVLKCIHGKRSGLPGSQPGPCPVFADHNSTTPVDPAVSVRMTRFQSVQFANPSSDHGPGWAARLAVEEAREEVARLIGARPDEVFFTSGATESNNWVFQAFAERGDTIFTSPIEHKSVLAAAEHAQTRGADLHFVPVDGEGRIAVRKEDGFDPPSRSFVSLMAVNNEVHSLLDLPAAGARCLQRGAFFHSDAAQALGAVPLDVGIMGLSALSLSAHKIYGPKGIGALFVSRRWQHRLTPWLRGGGQEGGLRSGTLPVPLIVGFGQACKTARRRFKRDRKHAIGLARTFLNRLSQNGGRFRILGPARLEDRKPGSVALLLDGLELHRLTEAASEIVVSGGSACTSRSQGNHVLEALGIEPAEAPRAVRVAFGRFNTARDARTVADALARHSRSDSDWGETLVKEA